jgi:hypothetical protein
VRVDLCNVRLGGRDIVEAEVEGVCAVDREVGWDAERNGFATREVDQFGGDCDEGMGDFDFGAVVDERSCDRVVIAEDRIRAVWSDDGVRVTTFEYIWEWENEVVGRC